MFLYRVAETFQKHKVSYAVVGGWAVALHGAVRGTVDLDVVVALNKANLDRAETALREIGLESRLPVTSADVIQFREEYIRNRNMKAWRFSNPANTAEVVDIVITDDLEELKTKSIKLGKQTIKVAVISELIRMKKWPDPHMSQEYLDHCKTMTPEQIAKFLDDFRQLHGQQKAKSQLISMKVPKPLLEAFKRKCELMERPYQTQIKELMTRWLGGL